MSHYQHILLATDFSKSSHQVIEKASEIAADSGATISLIHVVEYSQREYNVDVFIPDLNIEQELIEQATQKLQQVATEMGLPDSSQQIVVGSPNTEIVRIADENNCDLIILGSHGRHGLALLMGSTANGVLHHAHCDVLAVRIQ